MSGHPEDQIITDGQVQHSQHPHPHSQHPQHQIHHIQQQQQQPVDTPTRKPKAPSVRRACTACHSGKTRCSETLPCQNCLKRGIANTCAYPEPDSDPQQQQHDHNAQPGGSAYAPPPPPVYAAAPPPAVAVAPQTQPGMTLNHQQYYDYNGALTGASSSTFRPAKRPRTLTEEETAAITRNFSRGDFFVGNSAPVRIDPRLPVRLTLGEGDHVHFNVGNYDVSHASLRFLSLSD
ncbi:hypothetical protein R3P38DRAFT_2953209 [Favolaschia claudopus]|uniref:Zn(2)-C6 fungal-type domain-containing protein n=1 Tax=Favolaschia claudopus TaxID=2862362 RepID=A0AAW0BG19_9AGAR